MTSLRPLMAVQLAVVAVTALLLFILDRKDVYPFLCGAGLITLNFALLGQVWRGVLEKKSVALTTSLVVIKYAILVLVLYIFIKEWNLPMVPLFVGLTTMGATFLVTALFTLIRRRV